MKESMIEYILRNTEVSNLKETIKKRKKANQYERLHIRVDDQISYCETCKKVWKKNRKMYTREIEYFKKNHIPTIGKKRETCPKCKEQK